MTESRERDQKLRERQEVTCQRHGWRRFLGHALRHLRCRGKLLKAAANDAHCRDGWSYRKRGLSRHHRVLSPGSSATTLATQTMKTNEEEMFTDRVYGCAGQFCAHSAIAQRVGGPVTLKDHDASHKVLYQPEWAICEAASIWSGWAAILAISALSQIRSHELCSQ